MFDTHNHGPGSLNVRATSTVHERRAPTDASVGLLNEMEDKMLKRILSRHSLQDNVFNAEWYIIQHNHIDDMELVCRFKLNGQEKEIKLNLCRFDIRIQDPMITVKKVCEAVQQEIAKILTVELFQKNREMRNLVKP
jgi:hypothetical protein